MVWDWGSVEGLSCRVRGSIAKTDSKALLREFDTAKRHERRAETKDDREPCKYDCWRIEDRDRRRDIWESRDGQRDRETGREK